MDTPPDPQAPPIAPAPRPHREWQKPLLAIFGLVGLATLAYWPSLRGGFVWDDLVLVTKNPLAAGELNLISVWGRTDFSLSTVATWLEWLVFKDSAPGYRIVNLVLHCLSAVLFWRLLKKINNPNAWWGAAIFALHPMAVASVAWISELKNTLSLPCFLLSALAFVSFRQRHSFDPSTDGAHGGSRPTASPERKLFSTPAANWLYAGSLGAFLLALLAKTSTVMLPALLLLIVWWQNQKIARRTLLQLLPHFALALLFGCLTIYFQTHQAIRGQQVQTENLFERVADAGIAVWFYLGKTLAPVNLCAIYPGWKEVFPGALRLGPLFLLVGGLVTAWIYRKSWGRAVLLAAGGFTLALFPVLGLFDMYFMVFARVSDHFAYVALLVVGASAAAALVWIKSLAWRNGIAGVFLAGLMALTWQRAKVYATDEALWRDTVQKNPRAWNAHNNLACNFAERGDLDQAMKHFAVSLELNPKNAQAHRNLGKALLIRDRFSEAEPHFRAALELGPRDTETMTTYASGLAQAQRFAEGAELLRRADALKPSVDIKRQLVPFLIASGDYEAATKTLRAILADQPRSYGDLNNLAWLLATGPDGKFRNGPEAVRLSEQACKLTDYRQPVLLGTLAAAYAEAGDFTNAVAVTRSAIELATAAGNEQAAAMNRQMLKLYQAQRPFHLPGQNK
jgi:tetratricopeptide (TPR) repeat protein